uniref:UBX domain-containing protein 11 n=1 Tax=Lepisosteus oculatus TaxID=7918 RepID=W5M8U6_LEPOC
KMSSPLSTLRKNRRTPLPESQNNGQVVPHLPAFTTQWYKLHASFCCEKPTVPFSSQYLSQLYTSICKISALNCPFLDEQEWGPSFMNPICPEELKLKSQAQEIQQKEKLIVVLKEKVKILQNSKAQQYPITDSNTTEELEKRCLQLQNQVWEMERFFNDYGMVWVGEREEHSAVHTHGRQTQWHPGLSVVRDFHVNFDLVLENIKDLNVLAGEGESHVERTAGGARLARHTPLPLHLFKNGIVMFNGPFRPYEDASTRQCVQDLMDGYFPSELQKRFPEGVPFEVFDKRSEVFRERQRWTEFPGEGQAVGGIPLTNKAEASQVTSQLPGPKLSVEQFLNRLPKAVIKEGKVIDIRGSIRENLEGTSSTQSRSVVLIETPALQAMKQRLEMSVANRPPTPQNISTLRVKSEDGEQTFIVKMLFSETIGQLRQYLNTHRGEDCPEYDIISAFPQRQYGDESQTLQQCGLTPNATLLLRVRTGQNSSGLQ